MPRGHERDASEQQDDAHARPDDGFADASDPQADLLGSINRIYGVPGRSPDKTYNGKYGFITD